MLPRDMWPHSQAYRPLRVEGSTYLLFPSLNSPPLVGPLDVQELCSDPPSLHFCHWCQKPNLLPPGHQHPVPAPEPEQGPPGNCGKGTLSKLPSQAAALPLRESDQRVII